MFEHDEELLNQLLETDPDFQKLYRLHDELKRKVADAEHGVLAMDDSSLTILKKEKLLTKDKMALIIEQHRQAAAS